MKNKKIRVTVIVFGILLLLLILVWPAAPLWAKLGLKPFCLQGEWPHISLVSCPLAQTSITPLPLPSLNGQSPIPLIVDDDGSPDGVIALLYFLRNPLFDIQAVTISGGEAHPSVFAPQIQQLLISLGRPDIPVGVGREVPLEGDNAFPDPWRQYSDNFWSVTLPQVSVTSQPKPAAELIVDIVKNSSSPVLLFVSGPHTNLAEAIRLDASVMKNIKDVYIMGGSIYVPGNIHSDWPEFDNEVAEWNIWTDPLAAEEVFSSGLPLHLIPLDATRRVLWTKSDLEMWKSFASSESAIASELLQWMITTWSAESVYIWDLVAATQATNLALCTEVPLAIDIVTAPGAEQGRTYVSQDTPNANVCLEPDEYQVKALVEAILGSG